MAADSPLLRFRLWFGMLPPALRALLAANGVLYVAWLVLRFVPGVAAFVVKHLALTPLASVVFREPWQLLTHPFLNLEASFWGLISVVFALAWLNWIGREYEDFYGSHRLFGLYVMAGVWGALVAIAFWTLRPLPMDAVVRDAPLVAGAWAPVVGVLCGVATLHPDRSIGLLFLGAVPLRWVTVGFLVLSALFSPTHLPEYLGAALVGFVFAKAQGRGVDLAAWAHPLFRRASPRGGYRGYGGAAGGPSVGARMKQLLARETPEERPAGEAEPRRRSTRPAAARGGRARAGQDEVDRILDKILEDGFDALTDEEKRVLDEASRRS